MRVMVIFTRQLPGLVNIKRLLFVLIAQCSFDFAVGVMTNFVIAVLSITRLLSRAFVDNEVERPKIGVVNDCVAPTVVPIAFVAASLQ